MKNSFNHMIVNKNNKGAIVSVLLFYYKIINYYFIISLGYYE